jgi:hypothetical protein
MIQIKKFIKSILDKDKLTSHSDQSKQRNSSEKQNFQISSTFSETLVEEFSKIQDKEQVKIQQFEYLKMINSIWQIEGLVQKGQIEINSELKFIHQNIELGISFIKRYFLQDLAGRNILDLFTFFQLFKIGRGLYHILKKNLVLLNSELSSDFLGETLQNIHLSLEEKKLDIRIGDSKLNLELINDYELVSELINSLLKNLNWIKAIESEFLKLVENGQISDHFYLNHTIKSIDFESLVLTLFMNYYLSVELNENRDQKLAINIDDLKRFWKSVDIVGQNSFHEKIDKIGKDFCLKYQLQNSNKLTQLILWFLESNYLSLDIRDLSDEDFKFIGGAIILAN